MVKAGEPVLVEDQIGFASDEESTDETALSSSSYTGGSTPCGVTFVAPTSGRVLVLWSARWEMNGTGFGLISSAVRTGGIIGSGSAVSGGSAQDSKAIEAAPGNNVNDGRCMFRVITSLTAGQTYNAQVEMRVLADSMDVFDRQIAVIPIP